MTHTIKGGFSTKNQKDIEKVARTVFIEQKPDAKPEKKIETPVVSKVVLEKEHVEVLDKPFGGFPVEEELPKTAKKTVTKKKKK